MKKTPGMWCAFGIVLLSIFVTVVLGSSEQKNIDKKEDYKKMHLEKALQTTFQAMGYGSDAMVSIKNYDSTDNKGVSVTVILYVNNNNKNISTGQKKDIENLLLNSILGLQKDNIKLTIENVLQK